MSFSKTISVCAALTTIFIAAGTGYKLSQESQLKPAENTNVQYEQHIVELKQKISGLEEQLKNVNPPTPTVLPEPSVKQQPIDLPQVPQLPSPPPNIQASSVQPQ